MSVSLGCFAHENYYLCNTSSVIHMTNCCTAYDECNSNIPLPPKVTSLPGGIKGPPLTCLQSNVSNTTAGICSMLSGYCYLLARRTNNTIQYEQGCAQTCEPVMALDVQKSCCSTDQCNSLPQTGDAGTTPDPDTPVLYSCYCTTPGCNSVCVSTVGCYVDDTTGTQGCISSLRPCPAPNRTCCSGQWCNSRGQEATSDTTITPTPPLTPARNTTTVNNTTANAPRTTPQNMSTRGGGAVASGSELVNSKPFQGLIAMVLVLVCATILSLVAYMYIKRRSRKGHDPQLQQFIETSV